MVKIGSTSQLVIGTRTYSGTTHKGTHLLEPIVVDVKVAAMWWW